MDISLKKKHPYLAVLLVRGFLRTQNTSSFLPKLSTCLLCDCSISSNLFFLFGFPGVLGAGRIRGLRNWWGHARRRCRSSRRRGWPRPTILSAVPSVPVACQCGNVNINERQRNRFITGGPPRPASHGRAHRPTTPLWPGRGRAGASRASLVRRDLAGHRVSRRPAYSRRKGGPARPPVGLAR